MEYNLLKSITPQLSYLQPLTPYVKLTSSPSKDLINPGIGQTVRLYSFYVPLASNFNPYEIKKLDAKLVKEQSGFGDIDQVEDDQNQTNETSLDQNSKISINEQETNDVPVHETKKLSAGLEESLNFPKITIKKTIFKPTKKAQKLMKHKFQII